jgi:uncharacterized membrane protein YkoI
MVIVLLVLFLLGSLAGCGESGSGTPAGGGGGAPAGGNLIPGSEADAAAARQVVEQFATAFINGDDLTSYGDERTQSSLSEFNTEIRDKMIANLGAAQSYTIDEISMQQDGDHWVYATFIFANGQKEQFRFQVDRRNGKIYTFSNEYIMQLRQSEMRLAP